MSVDRERTFLRALDPSRPDMVAHAEAETVRAHGPLFCAYCENAAVRTDPFGGEPCCDECFNLLIGGDADDPPFRCGNCEAAP